MALLEGLGDLCAKVAQVPASHPSFTCSFPHSKQALALSLGHETPQSVLLKCPLRLPGPARYGTHGPV